MTFKISADQHFDFGQGLLLIGERLLVFEFDFQKGSL